MTLTDAETGFTYSQHFIQKDRILAGVRSKSQEHRDHVVPEVIRALGLDWEVVVVRSRLDLGLDPEVEARVCLVDGVHQDVDQLTQGLAHVRLGAGQVCGQLTQDLLSMVPVSNLEFHSFILILRIFKWRKC